MMGNVQNHSRGEPQNHGQSRQPSHTRGYSRYEQETIITWNDEEKKACIYASSPITMRKLDKLCSRHPDAYKCIWTEDGGKARKYEVASRYLSFRAPVIRAPMSEEQRAATRERMKKISRRSDGAFL